LLGFIHMPSVWQPVPAVGPPSPSFRDKSILS
jgi:hypothetical protein